MFLVIYIKPFVYLCILLLLYIQYKYDSSAYEDTTADTDILSKCRRHCVSKYHWYLYLLVLVSAC